MLRAHRLREGRAGRPVQRRPAAERSSLRSVRVAVPCAVLLLIVAGALALHRTRSPRPPTPYTPAHGTLLAELGEEVPFEARLWDAGRMIDQATSPKGAPALAFSGRELLAELAIDRDLADNPGPEAWAASGVRYLVAGAFDRAIADLERALLDHPDDPRILNDLAAAYLVRADRAGAAADLVPALRYAERASALDPLSPEAVFNKALALEALHLREAAASAWEQYLRLDPDADRDAVMARASAGRAGTKGTDGGEAVSRSAESSRGSRTHGVELLDEGIGLYQQEEIGPARETLERAVLELEAEGSPRALEAQYHLALCAYQEAEYEEALELLRPLIDRAEPARSPEEATLAGRAFETTGLIHGIRGRFDLALEGYTKAAELYETAGDRRRRAALESSLAEVWDLLGRPDEAWKHRIRALSSLHLLDVRSRVRILSAATSTLVDRGEVVVAQHFAEALLAAAQELGSASGEVIAYRRRALLLHRLGETRQALRALEGAEVAAADLSASGLGEIARADIQVVRGEILADTDPEAAVRALDEAIESLRATDAGEALPGALRLRARATLARGRVAEATRYLEEAVQRVSRLLDSAPNPVDRASFYARTARPVFDDAIALAIESRPAAGAGFAMAERALSAAAPGLGAAREGGAPSIGDVRRSLGPDRTLLVYRMLGERVILWRVEESGAERHELGSIGPEVEATARVLRRQVRLRGPVRQLAGRLHELVLQPAVSEGPLSSQVLIVPDGVLQGLPFALLWNEDTGRYLVEDHTIVMSPNASHALWPEARPGQPAPTSVLVVADPATAPGRPGFRRLPAARREAHKIAGLFPRSMVLIDEEATAARLLDLLGSHDVLHFAGHAVESHQTPFLSHLLLAPESGGGGDVLFVKDVSGVVDSGLNLVFLAACHSAGSGDVSGFGSAFLAAGAETVIGSLWEVEDEATQRLAEQFYRKLMAGKPPAVALRLAQTELLGSENPELRDPATWAAFHASGTLRSMGLD